MTGTEWNTKEKNLQQAIFGHWDPKEDTKWKDPKTKPHRTFLKYIN